MSCRVESDAGEFRLGGGKLELTGPWLGHTKPAPCQTDAAMSPHDTDFSTSPQEFELPANIVLQNSAAGHVRAPDPLYFCSDR